MRTDRAVTKMSSDWVAMRLIVNRMTDRHTLPSLAVGNKYTDTSALPEVIWIRLEAYLIITLPSFCDFHSDDASAIS